MPDAIRIVDLYDCKTNYLRSFLEQYTYPWELLPHIGKHIRQLIDQGPDGFHEIAPDVWVGTDVIIGDYVTIEPPAILGRGTVVRHGAYLRGNVITGEYCVLGNSSEFKNCILLDHVQAPHYNYVGDSVLGNRAHLGAGTICSNLKAGGGDVIVHALQNYTTGRRKVGAFLGDGADVGCGCVLNPATVVGRDTSVYPLTALRGVYPARHIVKSAEIMIEKR